MDKIYYAISNNGDGSVSAHFFKTQALAEWFEATEREQYDGWAEDCAGEIEFDKAQGADEVYIWNLTEYISYPEPDRLKSLKSFCKQFYPKGIPNFRVSIQDKNYYLILVRSTDCVAGTFFQYPGNTTEAKAEKLERDINQFGKEVA